MLDGYILESVLCKGNSIVYKAKSTTQKHDHSVVAIKENIGPSKGEIEQWRKLDHPNIIKILDYIEEGDKSYIIMEYASEGELFDRICRSKLTEKEARNLFSQLLDAVDYCHKKGILHNDIKLENILLQDSKIKLADFEFSGKPYCGSIPYAAPEVFQRKPLYNFKSDIWSLGIVLYAMVAGFLPFDADGDDRMISKMLVKKLVWPEHFSKGNFVFDSFGLVDLVDRMLVLDPKKRISVEEIRSHQWMTADYR